MKQIERIEQMERSLDVSAEAVRKLSEALDAYEQAEKALQKLCTYYGSTLWMKDYEDDEKGKLPNDVKRGVLSEDAVYDLLTEHREVVLRMMRVSAQAIEKQLI